MLTSLTLIFLCGLTAGSIFQKLRLPSLVGMLIVGIVIGPYALNLIDASVLAISADLRKVALIVILARAGLSLDFGDLKKIGRPALLMSFVPACFEMLGTIIFAPLIFSIPVLDAAILGAVIASASPAVIVPRMITLIENDYGTDKNIPQMILAGDSVDDVFNIVVFTSLIGYSTGERALILRFASVPISIISGIALGAATGFILTTLFKKVKIRGTAKTLILISVSLLLLTLEDILTLSVPTSALLSVMVMGMIILKRSPNTANPLSAKLSKVWILAEIILFVLVGSTLNLAVAAHEIPKTLLLLPIILTIRAVGILICLIKTPLTKNERLFCTLTGIPKATVQAAVGAIPLSLNLPNGALILSISILTILITAPTGAALIDATYRGMLGRGRGSF